MFALLFCYNWLLESTSFYFILIIDEIYNKSFLYLKGLSIDIHLQKDLILYYVDT